MKCRVCGSEKIHRSQRKGLKEGVLLRLILMAPFRCHDCGSRYAIFDTHHLKMNKDHRQSWAEYIGLRGRDYKLRQWILAFFVTAILLCISIIFLIRVLE
jgi:hypothetical protein